MENKKTVAISFELHKRIKLIAVEKNCSMEMVIEELVMKYLGLENISR